MSTLERAPLALLLDRLFAQDEAAPPMSSAFLSGLEAEERRRLIASKTEYRRFYEELRDLPLAVSRATGTLLYMLVRSRGAKSVVEFGTSFGISTLCLAAGLRANGGGLLITSEFEPSKIVQARSNFLAGALEDLIEVREGDALQTLATGFPGRVDMLLLDGAKALYEDVLGLVEPSLADGAMVIADNADFSPDYLRRVRTRGNGYLSLPLADNLELSVRTG